MKGSISFMVFAVLLLVHSSQEVYVQDGDLKFSLESVKKLKELMDENRHTNPRMVVSMAGYSPCDEKSLPEEFQPVCKREDAAMIFERLSHVRADWYTSQKQQVIIWQGDTMSAVKEWQR
ncbi:guanylin [Columba guinea]|nr:guanylin [Columba guinea]